ncbi:MAG: NAD(P)-dependent oxidoreductase [Vicinamibacterales bacterium]
MDSAAFLGLGVMGSGMASRLIDAGWSISLWNRRRERASALVAKGARLATSPQDAAASAAVVISMVADDEASRAIWLGDEGALAGAKPGTILIESSTLSPRWIEELAAAAAKGGCDLLDAPVTGSKTQAASGQLLFLVGGDARAFDRARKAFDAMGRDALHLGPTGSGATLKLINNFMCAVQSVALAEAIAMIELSGLDVARALAMLMDGAPGSPLCKAVAPRMNGRDYSVNFALALMRKDVAYAMAEADRAGVSLRTAAAARERFDAAIAEGWGDKDFAAVVEPLRKASRPRARTGPGRGERKE